MWCESRRGRSLYPTSYHIGALASTSDGYTVHLTSEPTAPLTVYADSGHPDGRGHRKCRRIR